GGGGRGKSCRHRGARTRDCRHQPGQWGTRDSRSGRCSDRRCRGRGAEYSALPQVPSVSLDNERVAIQINVGLLFDLPHLDQSGADGIGLFRTELQFMISATFPRSKQQTRLYKFTLATHRDLPVVFRSLDVGGDKVLPYFRGSKEENPAIGWGARRLAPGPPARLSPPPDAAV